MPTRERHYDPMIEQPRQASPLRGFQVQIGGVYVLLDDIVTVLREYALTLADPDEMTLVNELAGWLGSGERQLPEAQESPLPEVPAEPAVVYAYDENVDRVEIYPDDPTAIRPRWIARSVDDTGSILFVTNGSFDQDYVIRDAEQRWPDKDIHLLTEAGIDTIWEERDPGGIRSASSGRRRPSPKRLWA